MVGKAGEVEEIKEVEREEDNKEKVNTMKV